MRVSIMRERERERERAKTVPSPAILEVFFKKNQHFFACPHYGTIYHITKLKVK
jgi:hypothetical protein